MQKGEARVTTGKEAARVIKAGDIWIVPSNTMHGVEYLGDVEAIEIVSPPRLDNFTGYTIRHTFFEEESKGGKLLISPSEARQPAWNRGSRAIDLTSSPAAGRRRVLEAVWNWAGLSVEKGWS